MVESPDAPGGGVASGIEAVERYLRRFAKHWEQISCEPLEHLDAGDQVVW